MAGAASAHQASTASREETSQQRAGRTRRTGTDLQRAHQGATAAAAAAPAALDSLSRLQQLANASPQVTQLQRLQALANARFAPVAQLAGGPEEEELVQGKFATAELQPQLQHAPCANNTGLPDQLKSGIESLSGLSMDHVRVHFNSAQPAQLNALAYAQGSDIHLAPGQERHLPHEAWHAVQQAQGRVRPTIQMAGGLAVNDDAGLEREADVMGAKAAKMMGEGNSDPSPNILQKIAPGEQLVSPSATLGSQPVQRARADVSYRIGDGVPHQVQGRAIGQGGVGGQSHSEQGVWADVQDAITGALARGTSVAVTFSVDTKICHLCSPWFETTVFNALTAAVADDATFTLDVIVGDHTVRVDGQDTIWPNEIADAPTWDRLSEFNRMDRFMGENRDQNGDFMADGHDQHVTSNYTKLKEQMEFGQIKSDDIEVCLDTAKDNAVRLQVAAYNFRDDLENENPAAMKAKLNDINLYTIMSSERLGGIPDYNYEGTQAASKLAWKTNLTDYFQGWLEDWIQENLDDDRIQGENPHYAAP